jgi:hypothetical protein
VSLSFDKISSIHNKISFSRDKDIFVIAEIISAKNKATKPFDKIGFSLDKNLMSIDNEVLTSDKRAKLSHKTIKSLVKVKMSITKMTLSIDRDSLFIDEDSLAIDGDSLFIDKVKELNIAMKMFKKERRPACKKA